MDGLEAVEISLRNLMLDNAKFRLDNEFFIKKFVYTYDLIKKMAHTNIVNEMSILTDFHANGSYEMIARNFKLLDAPDFAYMVRSTDLESGNYEDGVKYISESSYNFLAKSKVFGGELLINKIGSPGRVYLMPELNRPVSLGMNLFMLRFKETSKISSEFLWIYFNTSFGKNIILRKVNGTVPLTIDKESIKSLCIPVLSLELQNAIEKFCVLSEKNISCSKSLYAEAEAVLLLNLGFADYAEGKEAVSVKKISESFVKTGRLDSEYYQPKYEEILQVVSNHNQSRLDRIVDIKKSIEPGSEFYGNDGVPFVRVSNLSKYGVSEPNIKIPFNTVKNIEELYPKKDTILLSKDGTVGIAYKVEEDMRCVTSGAILHLKIKIKNKNEVLPEYLTLVLNSIIVQMQAERDAGGSIIQHWKPSEIGAVVIPILDILIQKEIATKVQESFALRKKSAELLDLAKTAVEIAIEKGEEQALELLRGV